MARASGSAAQDGYASRHGVFNLFRARNPLIVRRAHRRASSRDPFARALVAVSVACAAFATALTPACARDGGAEPQTPDRTAEASPAPERSYACDAYAAPTGDDGDGDGTPASPFRSTQRLVDALERGETGCLRRGVYVGETIIKRDGIVLTSAAGARAHVRGKLEISDDADDVTLARLLVDGRGGENYALIVNGDRAFVHGNEVRNDGNRGCIILGNHDFGRAVDVTIDGNRIHHCGLRAAEPERRGHGIYVSYTLRVTIKNNYIYDAVLRGIQLYSDAQETTITNNVIDGNGVGIIISGGLGHASNDTYIARNIVTNSRDRHDIEGFWPPGNPVGQRNIVEQNCVWGGAQGEIESDEGFSARNNVIADPLYVDRDRRDYRLRPDSPCDGLGPARPPA